MEIFTQPAILNHWLFAMQSGWNIDIKQLPGPRRPQSYMTDRDYLSPDSQCLALAYSVLEMRMGWYIGPLAIFRGPKAKPSPLLANGEVLVMPDQKQPWINERYFAITAYMRDGKERVDLPFIIFDIETKQHCYYPIKNSCICEIIPINNEWQIHEKQKDDRFASHDKEIIDFSSLDWVPITNTIEAKRMYWNGAFGEVV